MPFHLQLEVLNSRRTLSLKHCKPSAVDLISSPASIDFLERSGSNFRSRPSKTVFPVLNNREAVADDCVLNYEKAATLPVEISH